MKNRNLFNFLILIFVVAPAIHYFIGGENSQNTDLRNAMVVVQAVVGIVLMVVFGRKPKAE
jgi:uncharacterized membrane protein